MNTKRISDKHRSILEKFMKALTSRNQDWIRDCLKENVVWHIPPFAKSHGGADTVGKEGISELLFSTADKYFRPETMKVDIHFTIADETHGAIQFTNACKTASGGDYFNIYVFTFRLEDGLIAEAWEHVDSAHLTAQLLG